MGTAKSIKAIISELTFYVKSLHRDSARGMSVSFWPALPPLEPPVTSGLIYYYRKKERK